MAAWDYSPVIGWLGFPWGKECLVSWGVPCLLQGLQPWACLSPTCLLLGQPEIQGWVWKSFLDTSLLHIGPLSDWQGFLMPKVLHQSWWRASLPCALWPAPVPGLPGSEMEEPQLRKSHVNSSVLFPQESLLVWNILKEPLISVGQTGCSLLDFLATLVFNDFTEHKRKWLNLYGLVQV